MNKLEELNNKIVQFSLEKEQIERIYKHIKQLNRSIEKTEEEKHELHLKFDDESADVEELESGNLRSVFLKFLGKEEDALEFEKQEMLWAYMSLKKAIETLKLLKYEKSILTGKVIKFEYDEEKFKDLLNQKELLLKQFPQMRIKLNLLDHKINSLNNQAKEIEEVLELSDELSNNFEQLSKELTLINQRFDFSTEFYGKGHYSSYKKKKFVERNLQLISRIMVFNDKLNYELKDLKTKYDLDFTRNLTMLNNFFVLFLDNLITDWIVRNGIISSVKTVEISHSKVGRLGLMLRHELEIIRNTLKDLNTERQGLIIDSGF